MKSDSGAPAAPGRLLFLDGLRGIALILMVLNHTSRWWMDVKPMGWGRYYLIYGSVILPASIFLFLVGFCLPISYRRSPERDRMLPALLKYGRRGLQVIAAGLLLNLVIFPKDPIWSGGVLQTIGLSIVVLGPMLPLLRHRWGRWGLLGLAVALYVAFALSYGALRDWVIAHPVMARIWFLDFPPWPWLSAALVGLVLGWVWLDARERGRPAEARYFAAAAAIGAVFLVFYLAWEWWLPTTPRFGFPRDFMLNRHWTPRGVTTALIIGGVACLLAGAYWLME
ncbi:MAG: heparan-alpha-glucosaminide N-acetyltransferase domain-containing protein, partial [Candidatus Rokuibacteriota bacterium]